MKKVIKIVADSTKLISVPESRPNICTGCFMQNNFGTGGCSKYGKSFDSNAGEFTLGDMCAHNGHIFIKEDVEILKESEKYTVEEVVNAIYSQQMEVYYSSCLQSATTVMQETEKFFKKKNDPQYAEFLRLKAIYE